MPKLVNHEARREAIAAAAVQAIADLGMDAVTTADLAAAAGCTVGALPRYFRNKDEILVAALRSVIASVRERAGRRVVTGQFDPLKVWEAVLPLTQEQRREWRVWIAFGARAAYSEALQGEFDQRYAQAHQDTRLMLATLQRRGDLPAERDVSAAAELMISVIDGLGVRATLQPKHWPAARQRDHVARALGLLGYLPTERESA